MLVLLALSLACSPDQLLPPVVLFSVEAGDTAPPLASDTDADTDCDQDCDTAAGDTQSPHDSGHDSDCDDCDDTAPDSGSHDSAPPDDTAPPAFDCEGEPGLIDLATEDAVELSLAAPEVLAGGASGSGWVCGWSCDAEWARPYAKEGNTSAYPEISLPFEIGSQVALLLQAVDNPGVATVTTCTVTTSDGSADVLARFVP